MSQFDSGLQFMRTGSYSEKKQLMDYLLHVIQTSQKSGKPLEEDDRNAILEYACEEVPLLLQAISKAASYKEKDLLFTCAELLIGMLAGLTQSPSELPKETGKALGGLLRTMKEERYIENALDRIFKQEVIAAEDVRQLLSLVEQTQDVYQRGMLFRGLVHYREACAGIPADAKALLAGHIAAEIKRYLAQAESQEDCMDNLELIADISRFFAYETVVGLLYDVLKLGNPGVSYYAVDTLLSLSKTVPAEAIETLAKSTAYANLTYASLTKNGKQYLFPDAYAAPEYLAKSDMVHWLMYPTELGKEPDEIEYIGKITYLFKKEVYYVFRYRSNSDTLDDNLKNKWLIGWSSENGGTFSNFDAYANFEKPTIRATLKNIKKKLIG